MINEWTTQAAYARLAAVSGNPILGDLLRRIMKQEGRHIDFYLHQARAHLEAPAARRTTRLLLRRVWKPVGSSVMPSPETRHLTRTLFSGDDGRTMLGRIDRRIDELPGLRGLDLLSGAFGRYAA